MVVENKCSVCLDIGHLVVNGYNIRACCDAWFHSARILHLHGVTENGRDHVDLSHLDRELLGGSPWGLTGKTVRPWLM